MTAMPITQPQFTRRAELGNDQGEYDEDPDAPLSPEKIRDRQINALLQHHWTTAEQIQELSQGLQRLRADIPQMMAEGIRAAVGDPQTWAAARQAMRSQAQTAAGGWMLGLLKFAFDKLLWALVALVAIYWAGGMPALLALLKAKVTTQ